MCFIGVYVAQTSALVEAAKRGDNFTSEYVPAVTHCVTNFRSLLSQVKQKPARKLRTCLHLSLFPPAPLPQVSDCVLSSAPSILQASGPHGARQRLHRSLARRWSRWRSPVLRREPAGSMQHHSCGRPLSVPPVTRRLLADILVDPAKWFQPGTGKPVNIDPRRCLV